MAWYFFFLFFFGFLIEGLDAQYLGSMSAELLTSGLLLLPRLHPRTFDHVPRLQDTIRLPNRTDPRIKL